MSKETGRMRGNCLPASLATSLHPQHPCPAKFWPPHHPCWECTPQTGRVLAKFSSGTNVKPFLWGRCVKSVTALAPPGLAPREKEYVAAGECRGPSLLPWVSVWQETVWLCIPSLPAACASLGMEPFRYVFISWHLSRNKQLLCMQ